MRTATYRILNLRCSLVLCLVGIVWCCCVTTSAQEEPTKSHTVETAINAMKLRASGTSTVVAEWIETEFADPQLFVGKDLRVVHGSIPDLMDEKITTHARYRFVMDGSKWKWSVEGRMWDNDVERFERKQLIYAFDGTKLRLLNGFLEELEDGYSLGYIQPSEKSVFRATMPQVSPLFVLYRPFDSQFGHLKPERWQLNGIQADKTHAIYNCDVLTYSLTDNESEHFRVWLAREHAFLPVRYDWGGAMLSMELYYPPDGVAQEHPDSWTWKRYARDLKTVESVSTSEVSKWTTNAVIPEDEFSLVFPPRTKVWDYTTSENGLPKCHVVRFDGTIRPVTDAEIRMGIGFHTLLRSEPADGANISRQMKPKSPGPAYHLIAYGVTFVTIWLVYRRLKQKAQNENP